MHIIHAQSRAQAKRVLGGLDPVPLVFTEPQLPDGTWADILAVAEKASQHVNVIVVARSWIRVFTSRPLKPARSTSSPPLQRH